MGIEKHNRYHADCLLMVYFRFGTLKEYKKRLGNDGLSSIVYNVDSIDKHGLYTVIKVKIDRHRTDRGSRSRRWCPNVPPHLRK